MSHYKNTFKPDDENFSWTIAYNFIDEGTTVLDIGCGNGNFGEALKRDKGCTVTGVEPAKDDSAIAKKKLDDIIVDTIENATKQLIKENKTFDHIVFLDVIEHLLNPSAVLSELKKILNPKGTIVFSIPNMTHMSVRLMLLGGQIQYGNTGILDSTHVHFYNDKEVGRVFADAGYSIEKVDTVTESYTNDMLIRELKKIGITGPQKQLITALHSNGGDVYQLIGSARVNSKAKKTPLPNFSPNTKMVHDENYESIIDRYKQHAEGLQAEVDKLRQELAKSAQADSQKPGIVHRVHKKIFK